MRNNQDPVIAEPLISEDKEKAKPDLPTGPEDHDREKPQFIKSLDPDKEPVDYDIEPEFLFPCCRPY